MKAALLLLLAVAVLAGTVSAGTDHWTGMSDKKPFDEKMGSDKYFDKCNKCSHEGCGNIVENYLRMKEDYCKMKGDYKKMMDDSCNTECGCCKRIDYCGMIKCDYDKIKEDYCKMKASHYKAKIECDKMTNPFGNIMDKCNKMMDDCDKMMCECGRMGCEHC